jgi:nucleotide-binding universal stress UspA family protein
MKSQFRKIVIGVDFSDASLAGARWVVDHLAPQAELLIVHVVAVPSAPIYLREYIGPTINQRAMSAQRLYTALRGFAGVLGSHRIRVGIRTGVPWIELARVADEVKADLICVGRGQKRQGSSRFGATTPQRLLAISRVPVLVIPHGVVAKPVRVLAALSARAGEDGIIRVAEALGTIWGSRLEAVHVVETEVQNGPRSLTSQRQQDVRATAREGGRSTGIDSLDEVALCALASEWLASTVISTGDEGLHARVVRLGDAGQELIASMREKTGPSVIVMGRTGSTGPVTYSHAGYHCGSTMRMVLWASPGPVFVLPLDLGMDQVLPARIAAAELELRLPVHQRNGERMHFLAPAGRDFGGVGGGDAA